MDFNVYCSLLAKWFPREFLVLSDLSAIFESCGREVQISFLSSFFSSFHPLPYSVWVLCTCLSVCQLYIVCACCKTHCLNKVSTSTKGGF